MKFKLTIPILSLLIFFQLASPAQDWVDMMQNPAENFYDVQEKFNHYWQGKTPGKGEGWKQFKRWEYFMEPRVYPSGTRPPSGIAMHEHQAYMAQQQPQANSTSSVYSNWSSMGPSSWMTSSYNPGIGRVNCIGFHPSNSNKIYIGSPSGGLWQSVDGGSTWTTHTDNQTVLGVSGIAIDPDNPDTMYIATGDGDGGDTYSVGVLKTVDGGLTWNAIGPNWTITNYIRVRKIVIHPTNHSLLILATSNGIYRTTNGGSVWSQVATGNYYDIEFKPGDPSIIYAAKSGEFYRSTNTGASWSQITSGLPSSDIGRTAIAVTPANSNYVYFLGCNNTNSGYKGLYRSTNSGVSFTTQSTTPNILGYASDGSSSGGQGWYDLAVAASPVSANEVYVGGINVWKSTNGGVSWNMVGYWYYPNSTYPYVHADIHALDFNGTTLFAGCDGGIWRTTNGGNSWTDLSFGLTISQFYRFGGTEASPNLLIGGTQDNGTNRLRGTSWTHVLGADGMEALISHADTNVMYACIQSGGMRKSTNGGNSFSSINVTNSEDGAWVTPYVMHPTDAQTLYVGYENVWKTTNGGSSFSAISNFSGSATLRSLAVSKSNPDYIFAATYNTLYKTTNAGSSWTNITSGLPTASITYLAVHPSEPNRIWVTFSGYSSGNKVYYSANGGSSWQNISGTLPNLPVNCIVFEEGSADALYIGTDVGIYFRDSISTDWETFFDGLPRVIVHELEINYAANKIRAATHGRGIWESFLATRYNNNLAVISVVAPSQAGRQFCNSQLSASEPVSITFRNLGLDTIQTGTGIPVGYSINGSQLHQETFNLPAAMPPFTDVSLTFSQNGNFSTGTSFVIKSWTARPGDENIADDTFEFTLNQVPNLAIDLPLFENFEATGFDTYRQNAFAISGARRVDYSSTDISGRLRTGLGTAFSNSGGHALTLDREPNGSNQTNHLTFTVNLANYSLANNIYFDFAYMDHGDEDNPGDSVWVRGTDGDAWIGIYDLNPNTTANGSYNQVTGLNLTEFLQSANQSFGQCSQIRFGQEDNWPATSATASDGISFDDIHLYLQTDCIPTYQNLCSSGDYIDDFSLHTLQNLNSGCSGNANNYTQYETPTTQLRRGETYTLTIQGGPTWAQGFGVWIDYNNDKDWMDAGEFVFQSPGVSTNQYTTNITIPANASLDTIHVRVRCRYNLMVDSLDICNEFTYGETEDYKVIILPAPDVGVSSLVSPSVYCEMGTLEKIHVNVKNYNVDTLPVGFGIPMAYTINGGSPVPDTLLLPQQLLLGDSAKFLFTTGGNFSAFTTYTLKIWTDRPIDNDRTNDTLTVVFTNYAKPLAPTTIDAERCDTGSVTLFAAPGAGGDSCLWYADSTTGIVLHTGMSYTTNSLQATTTYFVSTFSSTSDCESNARAPVYAIINPKPSYPNTFGSSSCGPSILTLVGVPGSNADSCRWYSSPSGGTPLTTGNAYTTPFLSTSTYYYVSSYNSQTGCEGDSLVPVLAEIVSVPLVPSASGQTRCGSGSVTLTGVPGQYGDICRWYAAASGGVPVYQGNTFTTPTLSNTTNYWVSSFHSISGCESASRIMVTVTILPVPGLPSASGTSICGNGSVTLYATVGANGDSVYWYSNQTGGVPLASGLTFVTPTLTGTTSYFISSYNSQYNCESTGRTQVTVIVNPIPGAPSTLDSSRCGPGSVLLQANPGINGNELKWYISQSGGTPFHTGPHFTTPFLSSSTTYFVSTVDTTTGCESTVRSSVTAYIRNLPGLPSASGDQHCGPGSGILLANAGTNGNQVIWYDSPSGTNPVDTGTIFQTPVVNVTTTWYVATIDTQTHCISSGVDSATLTIHPLPMPGFIADTVCLNDSTHFMDTSVISSGSIVIWSWDFGDATNSSLKHPAHLFAVPGVHHVKLALVSDMGCIDSVEQTILVNNLPDPGFNITGNLNGVVNLKPADTTLSSYYWDFGDTSNSTNMSPTHTYQHNGVYTITLMVWTQDSCFDSSSQSVVIELPDGIGDPGNLLFFEANPNPFSVNTLFTFQLSQAADIKLEVFDILGRQAALLRDEYLLPGKYQSTWTAPAGTYIVKLQAGGQVAIRKIISVR